MQLIHIRPEKCWMNDPNGFIYYQGTYHLFYQCFPYAPRWGRMHWWHVVSNDLVHWENRGIVLYPTKKDDSDGCFSGCAVACDDVLHLFYTGVHYLKADPEDVNLSLEEQFVSAQMHITSKDGYFFDGLRDKETVIPVSDNPKISDPRHSRDPKVWKDGEYWYMILGSTRNEEYGKLLFYRSEDLVHWEYVNSASSEKKMGWMWECPDYFEVDQEQVLIFSPMGFLKDGKREEEQTVCMLVDFHAETCEMRLPGEYGFFDYGLDLYAPQSTEDAEGRRVVVAWARMPDAVDGWIGMLCAPRLVQVKNHHIYFPLHPNVRTACSEPVLVEWKRHKRRSGDGRQEEGYRVDSVKSAISGRNPYRLTFSLQDGEWVNVGGYQIVRQGNYVKTDRSSCFGDYRDYRMEFTTPQLQDGCCLEVLVDENLIEIFVNDGEYVISNVVLGLGDEITVSDGVDVEMYRSASPAMESGD